jgi:hypothetical protein
MKKYQKLAKQHDLQLGFYDITRNTLPTYNYLLYILKFFFAKQHQYLVTSHVFTRAKDESLPCGAMHRLGVPALHYTYMHCMIRLMKIFASSRLLTYQILTFKKNNAA